MLDDAVLAAWDELTKSKRSIGEDFALMIGALNGPLRDAARKIDIVAEAEGFSKWLSGLLQTGAPNSKMKVLYLGLGERTLKSYGNRSIGRVFFGYALGGDTFETVGSENDEGKWLPEAEWTPASVGAEFWDSTRKESCDDWFLMLGVAILCAKHFFLGDGRTNLALISSDRIAIGVGFPEGDLYEIQIP